MNFMDKCMLCGKTYEYPSGLVELRADIDSDVPGLIWVDRALTACVCEDCYKSYATENYCPECGTVIFTHPRVPDREICIGYSCRQKIERG